MIPPAPEIGASPPNRTSSAPNRSPAADARRAAFRLLLSSAFFALMASGTKLVTRRLPGPEVALVRFVAGVVVVAAVVGFGHASLRPRRWGWLLMRGLFGGASVVTYFAAIKAAPVSVATLLNQTQPVFTMLFSWMLLRERPRRIALYALVLTLAGVAAIVGIRHLTLGSWRGEILGVASAIGSGIAVTSVRASRRAGTDGTPGETTWSVFFSFTFLGALVTLPTALPPFGQWLPPSAFEWALLGGVALTSVAAQVIMTEAIGHLTGVQSGIISQLTVPMTVAVGVLFLGERLTASFLAGAGLIAAGVTLTIVSASARARAQALTTQDIVIS